MQSIRNLGVADGTASTYLIGEKYLNSKSYETGRDPGDNGNMYSGMAPDQFRLANRMHLPWLDRWGRIAHTLFGGPHPAGVQFVFCDGSVRTIRYDIDRETHEQLGNREDGRVVDFSAQ